MPWRGVFAGPYPWPSYVGGGEGERSSMGGSSTVAASIFCVSCSIRILHAGLQGRTNLALFCSTSAPLRIPGTFEGHLTILSVFALSSPPRRDALSGVRDDTAPVPAETGNDCNALEIPTDGLEGGWVDLPRSLAQGPARVRLRSTSGSSAAFGPHLDPARFCFRRVSSRYCAKDVASFDPGRATTS